jgi:hypothetical protein
MKQVLYTCARCGKQVTVEPSRLANPKATEDENLPVEWAEIRYRRVHTAVQDGQQQVLLTACTAHACDDCAKSVLDYLEPPQPMQRQTA